jgi:CDP-2,3-bis-(O-geranylgeranyl)-sn-glycerol synthase
MLHDIAFALWFMLPAACANTAPILAAAVPFLKTWDAPMDFGKSWRGQRIFGSHKTWRGLLSGIIVATLVLWLEKQSIIHYGWALPMNTYLDYTTVPVWLVGPLFAIGALGGDAAKSFLKRRRGIESGKRWFPFDQLDYIIGAILVSLPFVIFPVSVYIWMLVLWFGVHILATYVGWRLKLKDSPI